uniref:Uncharacterized protein n=1 Tax=Oryza sativa subsp. japonica TaxID=39947 RepID=Q2R3W8_ORYSJ|nr:hypothetical protein LOC_Os11g30510 [Oryza sativa Japonica Group]
MSYFIFGFVVQGVISIQATSIGRTVTNHYNYYYCKNKMLRKHQLAGVLGSRWGEAGEEEDRRRWPATGDAAAAVTMQEQVRRRSGQVMTIISEQFPPYVGAYIATFRVDSDVVSLNGMEERSGTAKTAKRRGGWGNDVARTAAVEQERQASQVLGEGARRHPGLWRRHRRDAGSSGLPCLAATTKLTSSPASPRLRRLCMWLQLCRRGRPPLLLIGEHGEEADAAALLLLVCEHGEEAAAAALLPLPPPPPSSLPVGRRRRPARSPREKKSEREKRKGEKRGKKEEADLDRLICGAYVGPTLTQQPRRIKPRSKPLRDLLGPILYS